MQAALFGSLFPFYQSLSLSWGLNLSSPTIAPPCLPPSFLGVRACHVTPCGREASRPGWRARTTGVTEGDGAQSQPPRRRGRHDRERRGLWDFKQSQSASLSPRSSKTVFHICRIAVFEPLGSLLRCSMDEILCLSRWRASGKDFSAENIYFNH